MKTKELQDLMHDIDVKVRHLEREVGSRESRSRSDSRSRSRSRRSRSRSGSQSVTRTITNSKRGGRDSQPSMSGSGDHSPDSIVDGDLSEEGKKLDGSVDEMEQKLSKSLSNSK